MKNPITAIALRLPIGKTLTGDSASGVISKWKKERTVAVREEKKFEQVAYMIENRLERLASDIPNTAKLVVKAKEGFRKTKDPQLKARAGRKLLLTSKLHQYQRESQLTLDATVDRVKAAIEDTKLVAKLIQNRVDDAEIYFQLNGQLKLVGKALAAANSQYAIPEVEYQNYEFSMEQVEKKLDRQNDDKIIEEATLLLKGK